MQPIDVDISRLMPFNWYLSCRFSLKQKMIRARHQHRTIQSGNVIIHLGGFSTDSDLGIEIWQLDDDKFQIKEIGQLSGWFAPLAFI